jgi:hypothetical protein
MNLAYLLIWITWGLFTQLLGFEYDSWQFWTIAGMIWASNQIGKIHGEQAVLAALAEEILSQEKNK